MGPLRRSRVASLGDPHPLLGQAFLSGDGALAEARPGIQNTAAGQGDARPAFDGRRLFGLGLFALLGLAVWFALRISGLRREERVAVIES